MRFGDHEIPGGLLVMPAFVVVAAILVLWAWYYYSRQTAEMRQLAASRGWRFLGKAPPPLRLSLDATDDDARWRPSNVILVEGPPNEVYLFHYQTSYASSEGTSDGAGCLAVRSGGRIAERVNISPRPPLLDGYLEKVIDDFVDVGGPDFRRKFMVRCSRQDAAASTVTSRVQELALLRQSSRLKWDALWIAGRHVFVTVAPTVRLEDWDELLGIARNLRAALP